MIQFGFNDGSLTVSVDEHDREELSRFLDLIVEHTVFNRLKFDRINLGPTICDLRMPCDLMTALEKATLIAINAHHHFIRDNFVSEFRVTLTATGGRFHDWLGRGCPDGVFRVSEVLGA